MFIKTKRWIVSNDKGKYVNLFFLRIKCWVQKYLTLNFKFITLSF